MTAGMTQPNYLDSLADDIGLLVPDCPKDLLRLYAVLALAKGDAVTLEDVHNAWTAWRAASSPGHPALVPFDELSAEVQQLDAPYAEAIRRVASHVETDPEPKPGRLARVEVKGFRDLGIVRITETTLAGEAMLHAEKDDGSAADFPASSVHFITWLPEGTLRAPATAAIPARFGSDEYDELNPF